MNTLPGLFQSSVLITSFFGILAMFTLIMIAGLQVTGAKPEAVAKATSCYIMKTFGLVVLGLSAVQVTFALITLQLPDIQSLLGLVLLFVIGIGIMVYESGIVSGIDAASKSVPHAIFNYSAKLIGGVIAVISGLSLMMTFILGRSVAGWEMSASLLLLGCILCLASSLHAEGRVHKKAPAPKKKR